MERWGGRGAWEIDWKNGVSGGVAWPRDAKPTPPGAVGSAVDQNGAKTLPREAV